MSGSTIGVRCWGCNLEEVHPMKHGEEALAQEEDLYSRGWCRRSFGPSSWDKGAWFCSQECAHESYNAKRAEEYWINKDEADRQREFEKYCRETPLPYWVRNLAVFIIAFLFTQIIIRMIQ